jgi:hypothetical protein
MQELPIYVSGTFLATVLATFVFLFYAINAASPDDKNFTPTIIATFIGVWLFVIALLTYNDFFRQFDATPPRFILIVIPPILTVLILFLIPTARAFFHQMPLTVLTYIHIVRVPVEIVLWWLAINQALPMELTFEGMNYDILSGISAPFAGIFFVGMRSKAKIAAIIWNLLTLGLLIVIVFSAISATPYFYESAGYQQPNIAVFYFPYVWLPAFVVPVIFFSHMVSLYKLFTEKEEE